MKTKKIILFIALVSIVAIFSCQKSRYCFCVTDETNPPDTLIVNTDRNFKCKHLMQLGTEAIVDGEVERNYHIYTCTQIDKDTIPTIPNLPVEE